MLRISTKVLDAVFYLYDSESDAKNGENFGGTGFLVAVPSERFHKTAYLYAVTNWHIACRGSSVVRLNTLDGKTDIIPYGPEQWEFDASKGYDIAVVSIPIRHDFHRYAFVSTKTFVTKEIMQQEELGPGEDVFMVGRFVDHDGGATVNVPSVRFGNISIMPTLIEQPTGKKTKCFCLDLHSRPGYSGSPVFVYRTPGYDLTEIAEGNELKDRSFLLSGVNYIGFLGIHFAHPEIWEITEQKPAQFQREAISRNPLITDGKYVKGLSGMTCVLPAWNIMEVLNLPKLLEQRRRGDDRESERLRQEGVTVPAAEASSTAVDANSPRQEDFTSLPNEAVQKPAQKD
jgi:Trypsin-like peptidase domain